MADIADFRVRVPSLAYPTIAVAIYTLKDGIEQSTALEFESKTAAIQALKRVIGVVEGLVSV